MMTSNLIYKLAAKIEYDLGVVCDVSTFKRTHRGRWGVRNGTWSWEMKTKDGDEVGSCDTVTECCRKDRVLVWANLRTGNEIIAEIIRV